MKEYNIDYPFINGSIIFLDESDVKPEIDINECYFYGLSLDDFWRSTEIFDRAFLIIFIDDYQFKYKVLKNKGVSLEFKDDWYSEILDNEIRTKKLKSILK
jgi:hypothetical protein